MPMKKISLVLMLGLVSIFIGLGVAMASSTDETKLEQEIADLNDRGSEDAGDQVVSRKIEKDFDVSEAQIKSLRERKLGYGEITVVYSLAGEMPGGITEENVNRIMTMRTGLPAMGWGRIAQELGTSPGSVMSRVENVNSESRGEMKQEHAAGSAMRRDKHEVKEGEQHREIQREMKHERMGGGMERGLSKGR
jgi:hypothetical protein